MKLTSFVKDLQLVGCGLKDFLLLRFTFSSHAHYSQLLWIIVVHMCVYVFVSVS